MTAPQSLSRIAADRAKNHTTRRFVGESVLSHRRRIGLVGVPVVRPNIPSPIECLGACLIMAALGGVCVWSFYFIQ